MIVPAERRSRECLKKRPPVTSSHRDAISFLSRLQRLIIMRLYHVQISAANQIADSRQVNEDTQQLTVANEHISSTVRQVTSAAKDFAKLPTGCKHG